MTQQIRSLSRFIASVGAPDENFAVLMDTMNNTEIEHRRSIHFYEETSAFLDEFIKNRANRHPKIRVRLTMNTITSSSHDTLLFLDRFPRNLAFKIGLLFNDKQASKTIDDVAVTHRQLPSNVTHTAYDEPHTRLRTSSIRFRVKRNRLQYDTK
ncbi:hypothetical protein DICVIV_06849 [Dictyocaulus viviparus]|uniref:Uncharacterized protein n=1 Tax=Dictyocaulus viviparus TaxID=29172 RepID=A0A0D8XTJ3_DICVI|nr:hypothetical protein DICVIV_06849 [Dictyocaulus viviparus]